MPAAQIKFKTAYGPKEPVRTSMEGQQTRTHQSGKDECDINKIMAKYVRTGVLDHQKEYGENYGFATSLDLLEAMTIVTKANEMFDDLPAEVRIKFNQDAGEFLDFTQDPENSAELIKMGLAKVEGESPPQKVVIVEATPAPPDMGETTSETPASSE